VRARSAITLVAAVVALVAAPAVALAQTQNPPPNTFADGFDQQCTVEHCTLREAVSFAFPGETIVLQPGTYVLDQQFGPLFPQVDLTIDGAGARATTITGGGLTKVLDIRATDVTLRGVTVTGGNGASEGSAGLGGAIYVFQDASLTIEDSAIAGNTATDGGGVYSEGALSLTRSTVSGNAATGLGGGVWGGDVEFGGSVSITSSTVSGNTASGGGGVAAGSLAIARSTIAGNTAGRGAALLKQSAGSTTINDTIVAAATADACAQLTTVTGNHNLSSDTTCPFGSPGDKQGIDPLLGALQNNGGPTNTQALLTGSPAIGGANPVTCAGTDQRGTARPQEGTCDIGAFEYVSPPTQASPNQPPPLPPADDPLPPPVAGRTLNALPKSGRVRVKLPGARRYVRLAEGQQVPVGTVFDTRKGHVTLVAAANRRGGTATSEFWAGIFRLGQNKKARPRTTLTLVEKLRCRKATKAGTAAKKKKRKTRRRLWGNGKGRFRTKGKHSAATVVGTKWLIQDRCNSSVTRVVRGRVKVRDFVKKKTVTVRKGNRYIARAR
jgi:CSLREA domain-containing protein